MVQLPFSTFFQLRVVGSSLLCSTRHINPIDSLLVLCWYSNENKQPPWLFITICDCINMAIIRSSFLSIRMAVIWTQNLWIWNRPLYHWAVPPLCFIEIFKIVDFYLNLFTFQPEVYIEQHILNALNYTLSVNLLLFPHLKCDSKTFCWLLKNNKCQPTRFHFPSPKFCC